jgi:hypothetical protein
MSPTDRIKVAAATPATDDVFDIHAALSDLLAG